ncbi:hypothetical protein MUK42_04575 [Musa troglodytarum]|uniref:Centromere protein C n=1 Tax=Musa troglodytarum TaxID=320322 RepID=A0A9E7GEA9_9LILI|nr:hypothetical protein MUK42_04575 [Musa troglodytarum]
MAVDLGCCSANEDPFADFSLLSLLPRTLGGALRADPPPLDAHETEVIKALLDSVVGSKEVLEQAHAINNSCRNVVNSSQDGNKTILADVKNRLVSRRPALGRKRAQFSLKPISSNPVPDVDFNSQIDHLDDPEEYFFAFEQLENAGKELKKLRGEVATEPTKNQQVTGRKRRPGILGKTVSYKHHFSATVDTTEPFSVSQEVLDQRNATSSKASIKTKPTANLHPTSFDQPCNLHSADTNNIQLLATEQEDSVADENNANNLLEKLLFSFRDLDEGEGTAFLRESLQIKSIEIGKIHLPELHSIQRNNFRTLENRVAKEKSEAHQLLPTSATLSRSPLADTSYLQRHTSLNDQQGNPYMIPSSADAPYATSRTPARSPLAVISNFQWRRSVDEPLEDPYMIPPSDDAPYSGDSCPTSCWQKKSLSPTANIGYPNRNGLLVRDALDSVRSDDGILNLVDRLQISVAKADKTIDDMIATEEDVIEHVHCSPESTIEHRDHLMTDDLSNFDGFNEQMEEGNRVQLDPLYERPDHDVEDPASGCSNQCSRDGPDSKRESTAEGHIISESDAVVDKCDADDNLQNQVNVGAPDVLVVDAEAPRAYPDVDDPASGCSNQCSRDGPDSKRESTAEGHIISESDAVVDKCDADDNLQNQVNVGAPDVLVVDAEAPRVLAHSTIYPDVDDPASGCSNQCSNDGPDSKLESTAEGHIISESDTVVDKCDADNNLQNQENVGAPDVLVVDAEAARVLAHSTDYPGVDDPTFGCSIQISRYGSDNKLESTTEGHIVSENDTIVDKCGADDNLQNQVTVGAPDVMVVDAEASRVLPVNEQSKDVHTLAGGNMEAQSCHTASGLSQNIEKKQKALPSRKDKQKLVSRRQSLADAGMIWNSGVRRSTRIKSRPLEYWRGERFLYGRIHDSLATVIGVKRSSPSNKGKLKVTSFVSEEYADLVAQAAQL